MRKHISLILLFFPFFLVSCASSLPGFLKRNKPVDQGKIPGVEKRISILNFEQKLQFDPENQKFVVNFPEATSNADWPLPWMVESHNIGHLSAGNAYETVWKNQVFKKDKNINYNAQPVIQNGYIFVYDGYQNIKAVDSKTGKSLWEVRLNKKARSRLKGMVGGGIGIKGDTLFVSTSFGSVFALDIADGKEKWKREFIKPFASAPIISQGRVYVITNNNEILSLSSETGETLWNWVGLPESARVMSVPAVAVKNEVVLAPFSSGELVALRAETGSVLWSDELLRIGRISPIASLNDIPGAPVIDNNIAYAMSQSGLFVALHLKNGQRLWEQPIGGMNTPWLAGEYAFIVGEGARVVCLNKNDGSVVWVTELQKFKNQKKRKKRISWVGPVVVNNHVMTVSSEGEIALLSVKTGELVKVIPIGKPVLVQPVVADNMIYLLAKDGTLIAMQ